jgi:hypothetical protein
MPAYSAADHRILALFLAAANEKRLFHNLRVVIQQIVATVGNRRLKEARPLIAGV